MPGSYAIVTDDLEDITHFGQMILCLRARECSVPYRRYLDSIKDIAG